VSELIMTKRGRRDQESRLERICRCPRSEPWRREVVSSPSRPNSRNVLCVWWQRTVRPECSRKEI